jgi:L-iditol 2-dehydrogenase
MSDLPETIRYAKDRVEDAIKVVVTNKFTYAKDIAAE